MIVCSILIIMISTLQLVSAEFGQLVFGLSYNPGLNEKEKFFQPTNRRFMVGDEVQIRRGMRGDRETHQFDPETKQFVDLSWADIIRGFIYDDWEIAFNIEPRRSRARGRADIRTRSVAIGHEHGGEKALVIGYEYPRPEHIFWFNNRDAITIHQALPPPRTPQTDTYLFLADRPFALHRHRKYVRDTEVAQVADVNEILSTATTTAVTFIKHPPPPELTEHYIIYTDRKNEFDDYETTIYTFQAG
eukprot:855949_1